MAIEIWQDNQGLDNQCWICGLRCSEPYRPGSDVYTVDCRYCGKYQITGSLSRTRNPLPPRERHKLAAYVRRRTIDSRETLPLDTYNIDAVISSLPHLAPHEKPDYLLVSLSKLTPVPGTPVFLSSNQDIALACASNDTELLFYVSALKKRGHIEPIDAGSCKITVDGWNRVAQLMRAEPIDSKTCFVALAFKGDMLAFYDSHFAPAIERAGFTPVRSDDPTHNEQIDARIVADIRRCRFLVADVTYGRQGVYFEAGYALGLGRPVIWTCKLDREADMHFDTRQYNHILWSSADELSKKLQARIEATI